MTNELSNPRRTKYGSTWRAALLSMASASLMTSSATAAIVLVDFGNNISFRGISVPNPDPNGNTWNSVQTGLFYPNLVDITNTPTTIDFGFSTAVGTDSYNGPAGDTSVGTAASNVSKTDIDTLALGILGVREAAFDYVTNATDADPLRFEIQQLDPTQRYNLTFFGSHKFNTEDTTKYSIYTDNTYTTLVGSVDLLVGIGTAHNRDQVAVLTNIAPQASNILYVQVDGATFGSGYLNSLAIQSVPEPSTALILAGGVSVLLGSRRRHSAAQDASTST
jgi:hypothetical protein